jgi:hypothetical protein
MPMLVGEVTRCFRYLDPPRAAVGHRRHMGLFDAARDAEGRPKANKLGRVAS